MTKAKDERAVVVTTSDRRTFYGFTKDTMKNRERFKLRAAQCVIYWGTTKGYPQLATEGPQGGTKLSTVADMEVTSVTAIVEVSEQGLKAWNDARGR